MRPSNKSSEKMCQTPLFVSRWHQQIIDLPSLTVVPLCCFVREVYLHLWPCGQTNHKFAGRREIGGTKRDVNYSRPLFFIRSTWQTHVTWCQTATGSWQHFILRVVRCITGSCLTTEPYSPSPASQDDRGFHNHSSRPDNSVFQYPSINNKTR